MRPLPIEWTKHLRDDEARAQFENSARASSTVLSRLYDLLVEWESELTSQESRFDDFSDPNWAYKQAFRNGDRSRIRRLKALLGFIRHPGV